MDRRRVSDYSGDKIEKITPIKKWLSLKAGDIIWMRKSRLPRKVINMKNGCIMLRKVRKSQYKSKFTVYVPNDRHFFYI